MGWSVPGLVICARLMRWYSTRLLLGAAQAQRQLSLGVLTALTDGCSATLYPIVPTGQPQEHQTAVPMATYRETRILDLSAAGTDGQTVWRMDTTSGRVDIRKPSGRSCIWPGAAAVARSDDEAGKRCAKRSRREDNKRLTQFVRHGESEMYRIQGYSVVANNSRQNESKLSRALVQCGGCGPAAKWDTGHVWRQPLPPAGLHKPALRGTCPVLR